ncbi:MAG: cyclopropane fatty-acyl-phospholipid synthase-like methyltransferase [Oleispira sp.]|jgi:cyclopropane fatty-acyl-phospholipid synthase-like methyltransferase
MNKPISEACLRNQGPIAAVLKKRLPHPARLLEIGSGTGQHAVFCARELPHITWQPSDLAQHHDGMKLWITEAALSNVLEPIVLDVDHAWPTMDVDHVFTANTVHFIADGSVVNMLAGVSRLIASDGFFMMYGPVNIDGEFTSEGNAYLDEWLKSCVNPLAGIKDLADIESLAKDQGLVLIDNLAMPANNRLLVFQKQSFD